MIPEGNENSPLQEADMKAQRDRILLIQKKIHSKSQKDAEDDKKSLKGTSSRSQSIEKMASTFNIEFNIQSGPPSEDDTKNGEYGTLIKKRNIQSLGHLDNEEEDQITKKVKLN